MESDKDGGAEGFRRRKGKPTTIDLAASEVRPVAPADATEEHDDGIGPGEDASGTTAAAPDAPATATEPDARQASSSATAPGLNEPGAAAGAEADGDSPAAIDEQAGASAADADAAYTAPADETAAHEATWADDPVESEAAPAPGAAPRRAGSLAGALAAGVVGGLIVLGGGAALIAADVLPFAGSGGQVAATDEIVLVETRISDLESRLGDLGPGAQELAQRMDTIEAAQSASPATDDLTAEVSDLRSRLDTLAANAPQMEPALQRLEEISAEMEALRSQFADVRADLPSATGEELGDAMQALRSEVADTLQELRLDVGARLETLQAGIGDARTGVTSLDESVATLRTELEAVAGDSEASLSQLASRLDAIEQRLDEGPTGGEIAALSLAVTTLATKVTAGEPFAADLALVQSAAPDVEGLDRLAASAGTGVPTTEALVASFPAQAVLATRVAPTDTGVMDRLLTGAQSLVNYRETGIDAADPIARTVAGIEASLAAGDLASARAAVETLPQPARAAASGWISDLDRRLLADRVVTDLTERILTRLQAPAQGQ